MQPKKPPMTLQMILILVTIGLMAGMLSGMVGVGGGIIVVPALVFFLGFTQKQAQGTSLALLSLPVVILAALTYYNQGLVEIRTVLVMAVAFLIGGFLGSKIALSVPEEALKRFFAVILFYTG